MTIKDIVSEEGDQRGDLQDIVESIFSDTESKQRALEDIADLHISDRMILSYLIDVLADEYAKEGRTSDALEELRMAVQVDPNSVESRFKLANSIPDDNLPAKLKELYELSELEPENKLYETFFDNAFSSIALKSSNERIRIYKEVLQLIPGHSRTIYQLGLDYYYSNRIDNAICELENISRTDNEYNDAQTLLSKCYSKKGYEADEQGNYSASIKYYEKAIDTDPTNESARHNLGVVYYNRGVEMYNSGEYMGAQSYFDKCKKVVRVGDKCWDEAIRMSHKCYGRRKEDLRKEIGQTGVRRTGYVSNSYSKPNPVTEWSRGIRDDLEIFGRNFNNGLEDMGRNIKRSFGAE